MHRFAPLPVYRTKQWSKSVHGVGYFYYVFQKCLVCTKDVNSKPGFIYLFVIAGLRITNPAAE
jgi:hypothetical protein